MKQMIVMAMAALCVVGVFGAQCEGKTQAGARCKREAAEGSKFCIGHADQAKLTKQSKEQDNGQCWAVTQAGARCKHKKDGAKDYCKQHAADIKAKTPQDLCRAMTFEGTRCTRKPEAGFYYCPQHRK